MQKIYLTLTMLFVVLLTGCASITGSKNQPVSVTAICDAEQVHGASCTITNDKGVSYATTPGTAFVHKSVSDLSVTCIKDKVNSNPVIVKSSNNANIW